MEKARAFAAAALKVVDISAPGNPHVVASLELPGTEGTWIATDQHGSVRLTGAAVVVSHGDMFLVDVSTPGEPSIEGVHESDGAPFARVSVLEDIVLKRNAVTMMII